MPLSAGAPLTSVESLVPRLPSSSLQNPPISLSFEEIRRGVGLPADIEVWNGELDSAECVDSRGNEYLLLKWYAEGMEEVPQTISITGYERDGSPESLLQFRVRNAEEADRINEALNLLSTPRQFELGLATLEHLARAGVIGRLEERIAVETPDFSNLSLNEASSAIRSWLKERGVDCATWGTGQAKPFRALVQEIVDGDGSLSFEQGQVYLENRVAMLWVETPDGKFRIIEEYQRFLDGRPEPIRVRRNVGGLPAEKVKAGEEPMDAAHRALWEELEGVKALSIEAVGTSLRIEDSVCFPGLLKRNTYYFFKVRLDEGSVRPNYREFHEGSKETVFGWLATPRS